ncbi:unnamed protein product [Diamesa serratosioi]
MIMKVPNCSGNNFVGAGDTSSYDSDIEDDFSTPPNEEETDDFSDYLWMENEEEFDKQEMQKLEEEALMEECIEAMLLEEMNKEEINQNVDNVNLLLERLDCGSEIEPDVQNSTLNPMAKEFIPNFVIASN